MPKVMPSQVVQTIGELFPHATNDIGNGILGSGHSSMLLGVINLVREIPNELLPLAPDDYARLVLARSTIEAHLGTWTARGPHGHVANVQGVDAITAIRRVLERCPDEYPPPATTELTFIGDNQLRDSIRSDIGTADRALQNAEWKAATVIAGGAIEALLLWVIQQPNAQANLATAIKSAVHSGDLPSNPPSQPESWNLKQFIEVASHLNAINPETKTAALLAKDFRNLIHPGRAARTGQQCNRATAMSTVASLEHLMNDLTP
jgi:hypothetical protein